MSELNESQRRIAETLDGMIVVDAGPGTGKTHTIVERYLNLIRRPDVSPSDVLLLTFTNNAATEMDERIKRAMAEEHLLKESKLVQAKTFDSFCLSVVMDSPEEAGTIFGMEEKLTRGASIYSNEALNREHFSSFLDRFLNDKGSDYGDWAAIASQNARSLLDLINKLMSRGIFPLRSGWFGMDSDRQILGDVEATLAKMVGMNRLSGRAQNTRMAKVINKLDENSACGLPAVVGGVLDEAALEAAAGDGSREGMLKLVHDVYYNYVRRCISEDRLTFGLNSMLAFALLYNDPKVRERNSYRYLMIDEFQDTNANQLMIALMVLKEPNLCVVGDWKQGIYGFRYVSIDNIVDFKGRATALRRFLNEDQRRVGFHIDEVEELSLDRNYRSSALIVENAFRCMTLEGKNDDTSLNVDEVLSRVVSITAERTDIPDEDTHVRYVQVDSVEDEADEVARCVRDYVGSGKYTIHEDGKGRPVAFGDIAVLCRKTAPCRAVLERLQSVGIPAYLQGDVEIMSTRAGKLALAWLRYVNNERDAWGYVPIMADLGYSLSECMKVVSSREQVLPIPREISEQREVLFRKKRRVTEMLTSLFAFHGLDDDITQSIITTLSTAHRSSLLTISDLIRIIEDGIREKTTYSVENSIDRDAVTIMTMHKSKGLEFPIVIIPYMDDGNMPARGQSSRDIFSFDEDIGVRCSQEVGRYDGGYSKIVTSWKTNLAKGTKDTDYSEERRLMFVAMSRAKQYETLICGPKPSKFMSGLSEGGYTTIEDHEIVDYMYEDRTAEPPDVSGYPERRTKMGVHTLMDFSQESGQGGMSEDADEVGGKGMEYGEKVHRAAQAVFENWRVVDSDLPELDMVREIVERTRKADLAFAEMDCTLPVEDMGVVLSGRIDLIAVYDDRVEIHDYKTDVTDRFEPEYEFQLSVYAEAASRYYSRPARCFIDYVSMGRTKEFSPLGMDVIRERVQRQLDRQADASTASR